MVKGGASSNGALFASLIKGGRWSTGLGSKGGAVLRALNFHLCGPGSNPLAILLVCVVCNICVPDPTIVSRGEPLLY